MPCETVRRPGLGLAGLGPCLQSSSVPLTFLGKAWLHYDCDFDSTGALPLLVFRM